MLDVAITYTLSPDGLEVATRATNIGSGRLPYGVGQHPYLSVGTGIVDDAILQLPASTRLPADPRKLVPTGSEEPVEATPYDFREPRPVEALVLDDAFTDLDTGRDGIARATVAGNDGATVEIWMSSAYRYLQCYTGDTLSPARRRTSIAIEPMTCPPNALRSGEGLIHLEPGKSTASWWGVRLT